MLFRVVLLIGLALAPPVLAADAQDEGAARAQLERLEQQLEADRQEAEALTAAAEALRAEIESLRSESRALAESIQALEADTTLGELGSAVHRVAELRSREALEVEQARLVGSLAALQRLGRLPPEAALGAPGDPLDALRAARLLGGAVPTLERRAKRFAELHSRYARARAQALAERERLQEQAARLEQERAELARVTERRQAVLGETSEARSQAEAALEARLAEADDLRQLLEALEAEAERERQQREAEARRAAEAAARAQALREEAAREAERARQDASRRAEAEAAAAAAAAAQADARAQQEAAAPLREERPAEARSFPEQSSAILQMPAQGRIALRFGEEDRARGGSRTEGLVIEARPGAQVVAPFDGRIAYAGRFRRYGLILIIEHDGRYHSLLAGLGRLAATKGQWVLAGEPVGSMAEDGERESELYLELRRGGQPVDPLPWLALSSDKARG
ncbi:murein hydrolase activator EnvC family protein [Aquibaculum arenosum]|uniref:Peptidoglycan DD-metalloendopeptidase family protein n=1 Tax=Aquibaculum arenosum TaxID=3032591 RepID=A0ABT5YKW8_9PROT|nr:peptidoglycan DD-metalloendopeptidase family protein [Fodinicurvata sp. CAU 1616]MDF2095471.1 peptidoglycan DD-metalloendopeptidase family protein [Fodinicurvata sp. CAU 1616]